MHTPVTLIENGTEPGVSVKTTACVAVHSSGPPVTGATAPRIFTDGVLKRGSLTVNERTTVSPAEDFATDEFDELLDAMCTGDRVGAVRSVRTSSTCATHRAKARTHDHNGAVR